jgi:hypothetical protein
MYFERNRNTGKLTSNLLWLFLYIYSSCTFYSKNFVITYFVSTNWKYNWNLLCPVDRANSTFKWTLCSRVKMHQSETKNNRVLYYADEHSLMVGIQMREISGCRCLTDWNYRMIHTKWCPNIGLRITARYIHQIFSCVPSLACGVRRQLGASHKKHTIL